MNADMINPIICKMISFYNGNLHDIEHFLKVYNYASLIAEMEHLDENNTEILKIASIVHDISCPLCREKYGYADGKRQEEESEALLRPFLQEFTLKDDVTERVIFLVTHHHTVTAIDGIDYQILIEADFLVNASEQKMDKAQISDFYGNTARTAAGKNLLKMIFQI